MHVYFDQRRTRQSICSVTAPIMLQAPLVRQLERTVAKSTFDYLSVVGSLLHISNCLRPDISYAVGNLARFAAAPGDAHVKAAKRVLQYLFQSKKLGITYYRDCDQQRNVPLMYEGAKHPLDDGTNKTKVFADSDYAAETSRDGLLREELFCRMVALFLGSVYLAKLWPCLLVKQK